MEALRIISGVIEAIAWPLVILVLPLVFRRQLAALCSTLKKFKKGDWQAEWHIPGDARPEPDKRAVPAGDADLEDMRIGLYREHEGLFLVHQLRPSQQPGQLFDVGLFVIGHIDQTTGKQPPLGEIDRVEYQLGWKFGDMPIVAKDARSNFRINTVAYGPFACVARVHFRDRQKRPVLLKRYVDFENA